MPIILGGGNCWKRRTHGDISVAFHWIKDEPAMVLFPTYRRGPGVTPFAVPLSVAFEYAEDALLVEKATLAAGLMGFSTDKAIVFRIASIINDALPDLLSMPPQLPKRPEGMGDGELSIKIDGDTIAEVEV